MSEEDLLVLLQKAKQGDTLAFEKVYTHLFLPVYRYILKRVQNKTIAEDLTQTVFLKVYTSKTPFENKNTSPLAYFFTIAKNTLFDYWKNHKNCFLPEDDTLADPQSFGQTFEQHSDIVQALEKLDPNQRQILKMKFFEGYTTDEIAQHLNTTTNNIRQIQCRALKKLREYIQYE